jgi:hypothetical protein
VWPSISVVEIAHNRSLSDVEDAERKTLAKLKQDALDGLISELA